MSPVPTPAEPRTGRRGAPIFSTSWCLHLRQLRMYSAEGTRTIMSDLSGRTTVVVGASRGLGRGIATAFAEAGAPVVAVSRTAATFPEPANGSGTIQPEIADAGDATVPASLLDRYEPEA